MGENRREFPDRARAVDLGDPATDPPLTMRRHPDDNPMDPAARRVIRSSHDCGTPWLGIAGGVVEIPLPHREVANWPYTSMLIASAAFALADGPDQHRTMTRDPGTGTVTCRCGETAAAARSYDAAEWWRAHRREVRGRAAQAAERGDMGAEAFRGES